MSTGDDIREKLYRPSERLAKFRIVLFMANFIISLIAILYGNYISIFNFLLLVIALFYTLFSLIDDGHYWFNAERARRRECFQNAFKVRLDEYETQHYYNNNVADPELHYAINQFECIYFTKEICKAMRCRSILKSVCGVVILFLSCRFFPDNILLIISETVFSTVVIADTVFLIIFTSRIEELYTTAYNNFITNGISNESQKVWLKYFCVEYEAIKSYYRIRLSESLHEKLKPELESKWRDLSKRIILPETMPEMSGELPVMSETTAPISE